MVVNAENFAGFLLFVLLVSIPVAFGLSLVIRRRYRKAVGRAMMVSSAPAAEAFPVPEPTFPNGSNLTFDIAPLPRTVPLRSGLGLRYFASGLAYATVVAVVMFWLNDLEFLPLRFALVTAAIAFPALMMAGYVAGLRWYAVLALTAIWCLVMFFAFAESVLLLLLFSGPAMVLAFIIGNPALRTTAVPLFMVAVILVCPLIFSLDVTYALMVSGLYDGLLGVLPRTVVFALYVLSAVVMVLILGGGAALLAVRGFARLSTASSEFMMQHDLLWICHSFWMISAGWSETGASALLYLAAFPAYRLSLRALRPRGQATEIHLLLRVFGQQKSQVSLARGPLLAWRQKGPVLLIGAEDLANETLDPPELAAFLGGKLRDIFIETPRDLERLAKPDGIRLSDGLFRMADHYCRDNSWRATILTLMSKADQVLVDMRGLDASRGGIQFEIEALAQRVPADRILVVADTDTLAEVKAMFVRAWAALPGITEQGTLRIRTTPT